MFDVKMLTQEGFEGRQENQPVIADSIDKALRQRVTPQRSEVILQISVSTAAHYSVSSVLTVAQTLPITDPL